MNYFANVCLHLSALLLPDVCAICGADADTERTVCKRCKETLPRPSQHRCPRCGNCSAASLPCGRCVATPPAFSRVISPFRFTSPIDHLVHQLKYGHDLRVARWFADEIADVLAADGVLSAPLADSALIIPMPLHPRRLSERGFNQSLEIARQVSRRTGIDLASKAVRRVIDTASQTTLDRDARRRNLKGAFECDSDLSNHRILVIDDVLTTGSSADELSATLRMHGAKDITIACGARTEHA